MSQWHSFTKSSASHQFWSQHLLFLWRCYLPVTCGPSLLPVVVTAHGLSGTVTQGASLSQPRAGHWARLGPLDPGAASTAIFKRRPQGAGAASLDVRAGCWKSARWALGGALLLVRPEAQLLRSSFDSITHLKPFYKNYRLLELARLRFHYFQLKNPTWWRRLNWTEM